MLIILTFEKTDFYNFTLSKFWVFLLSMYLNFRSTLYSNEGRKNKTADAAEFVIS